jgi:DNA-binding HxlR family transcriptional regulator
MHEDVYGDEKSTKVECDCKAVLDTWKVLGKRWSLLILKSLDSKESIRFNELKRTLSGISSTVLADRLLELEREGLIIKKIYPEIPPKVEYSLTFRAKELGIILGLLGDWVRKWNSNKTSPSMQTQLQTQINTIKKSE